MDTTIANGSAWPLLLAGLLGLSVGLVAGIAFRQSEKAQQRVQPPVEPELDDQIVRVLSVLRSAVIALGPGDVVLRASPAAYAMGMVRGEYLVHAELRELVDQVRRTGDIIDQEIEFPRTGTEKQTVEVRIAHLTNDIVVIFAEDHTRARRMEQIRQDFAVNVSHELRPRSGD